MRKKEKNKSQIISCAKGNLLPTFLTPIFIVFEVLLEVFIPLLMAAIVDGGLYGEEEFFLKPFFPADLIADRNRFIITLGLMMICSALLSLTFGVLAGRVYRKWRSQ